MTGHFDQDIPKFHPFSPSPSPLSLPERFTFPFHYTPHPLCIEAAQEVQRYLMARDEWQKELQEGKMFGVLIVRNASGNIGFLAAFSGILAGSNQHPYFVPPIYDVQQPGGFFRKEEKEISAINNRIRTMEHNPAYQKSREEFTRVTAGAQQILKAAKEALKTAKAERDKKRLKNLTLAEKATLIRESQFQKAEYKRLEQHWKEQLAVLEIANAAYREEIEKLKAERHLRSATLQQKLFSRFRLLNAKGEVKDLCRIFEDSLHKIPPAGAGECAAPKLLQHAYIHQLQPLAMAEFWWGKSPKTEIRRHGHFYPACRSKCEPILNYMLQGLPVDPNPLLIPAAKSSDLEILYEDNDLMVIHKPAGMLSVLSKSDLPSVESICRQRFPDSSHPLMVHRLDMATSGLLLIAKNKEIHKNLQAQFKDHTIRKRYIALIEGNIPEEEGTIELPLCPDPDERPRQIVNAEYGKPAITRYRVLRHGDSITRVAFYPLTGRTHQLRVHAAHPAGLNAPILGDELYGRKAKRLYLHAEQIEFRHPRTGQRISIEKKADF